MITKSELRKKALHTRSLLNIDEISSKIIDKIIANKIYDSSKNVMIFYPLKGEINLLPLLRNPKSQGKKFYLPRVCGDDLLVCPYSIDDDLSISPFKTKEPTSSPIDPDILDIIFVPALLADRNLHRLGYGKGFYDRFLSKNKLKAFKIIPISSVMIKDKIPSEEFDSPVDLLIDEL